MDQQGDSRVDPQSISDPNWSHPSVITNRVKLNNFLCDTFPACRNKIKRKIVWSLSSISPHELLHIEPFSYQCKSIHLMIKTLSTYLKFTFSLSFWFSIMGQNRLRPILKIVRKRKLLTIPEMKLARDKSVGYWTTSSRSSKKWTVFSPTMNICRLWPQL